MKQVAFLWIFLMPLWLRGGLTDDAYRAYKRGEESRAFELYNMALQRKNSNKALYNIAVFYEKGIGVRKNLPKALEYYRMLFYRIDDKARQSEICRDPMLPWYRKTLKKLIRYEKEKRRYRYTLETLEETCRDKPAKPGGICTADGKIASRYRDWLDCVDCAMVRRHPRTIQRYLKLVRQREENDKRFRKTADMKYFNAHERINRKIKKVLIPIMKELTQKTVACVKKAKTHGDLQMCYYDYSYCADGFMGCHVVPLECPPDLKECVEERKRRKEPLTPEEREKAIRDLLSNKGGYFGYDCPLL
jgi:hypothetical protein